MVEEEIQTKKEVDKVNDYFFNITFSANCLLYYFTCKFSIGMLCLATGKIYNEIARQRKPVS